MLDLINDVALCRAR